MSCSFPLGFHQKMVFFSTSLRSKSKWNGSSLSGIGMTTAWSPVRSLRIAWPSSVTRWCWWCIVAFGGALRVQQQKLQWERENQHDRAWFLDSWLIYWLILWRWCCFAKEHHRESRESRNCRIPAMYLISGGVDKDSFRNGFLTLNGEYSNGQFDGERGTNWW